MENWIYCWELGSGWGHLARMKSLSVTLEAQGHLISWCVPAKLAGTARKFWPKILIAPEAVSNRNRVAAPGNFAEILQNQGWGQPGWVQQLVSTWQKLFDDNGFERVLADFAPGALLAAVASGRRVDVAGTGFYVPPRVTPLPVFRNDHGVYPDRLQWAESQVLSVVNGELGDQIQSLGELFHHPLVVNHLLTYPEMDHYGSREGVHYAGVVTGFSGDRPEWPDGPDRRMFAYLKPFPHLQSLLQLIEQMDVNLLVHGGSRVQALIGEMSLSNIHYCPGLVDERAVARSGAVMMNHAGHDGTVKAARAGVALLQFPLNIEQFMTAKNARQLGVADWLSADQLTSYPEALERLFASQDERAEHGENWAQTLPRPDESMQQLLLNLQ